MKALYTLLFSFTLFTLHAQSITDPSLPAEGKVMNFDQIDDTIAVSSTGPWDFSTINPTASYTMSVFSVDSSSNAANYPAASHVLVSATGEFFMGYDQNGITNHGRISSDVTTSYATPITLLPFPFDANTVHEDSIISTVSVGPLTAGFTDKAEVTGIAAGEVTMPNGNTYQNAVMARAKRTTVAGPSPFSGSFLVLEENSTIFWLQGYPLPVVEILHVFQNDSLIFQRSLFLRENVVQPPVGIASLENMSIELFPNPVGNTLQVNTEHAASLSLYNTKGELVIAREVAAGSTSIEVSNLTNGIYIYHIVDDKGNVSMNQLVKE